MKNYYHIKQILIGVLLLLSYFSSIGIADVEATFTSEIVVDGNGLGDFISIQSAINAANPGDTIFVRTGIYHENIFVDKTLTLIGEDKDNTIINGISYKDVIEINAPFVNISSFTIQNSGTSGRDAGIQINENNSRITDNIIKDNVNGVFAFHSNEHIVSNNIIMNNKDYGIHLYQSHGNSLSNNKITTNRWGIMLISSAFNVIEENSINSNNIMGLWLLRGSSHNRIQGNDISENNDFGICLYLFCVNNSIENNVIYGHESYGICNGFFWACDETNIQHNEIISNKYYGIYIYDSSRVTISENNFIDNHIDAFFTDSDTHWNGNYWEKQHSTFQIIHGTKGPLPWINIDRSPKQDPYANSNPQIDRESFDETQHNIEAIYDLPTSFSWSDVNGTNYLNPVKNQIPAPTCETYALCASLETMAHYKMGYPYGCDLSEAHLFFFSGGTCQWGVDATEPAEYLIDHGVPDEGCFPDPHRPYDAVYESLPGWEQRTVKITEWGWVNNSVDDIKRALIDHGPLVICQMTRKDLDNYDNGVYMPSLKSPIQRGHVVAITGYDDEAGCWIIRNSAGENWGEEGYFRISYEGFDLMYSFIFPFYGGSGILYVEGVYGNLKPDVPSVRIQSPELYKTYVFGTGFSSILWNIPSIQRSVPRILGDIEISITATDTNLVEFYIDGQLQYTDESEPFAWDLAAINGLHTLEVYAYNDENISKAMMDLYLF